MRTRVFALLLGIGFLIGGILGFVPRLVIIPPDQPPMIVGASHGLLLGLFPVNAVHNAVHLLFGVMPLQGLDVPLHAVIAIVAAYFGYAAIPAVESGPAIRRP